MMHPYIHKRCCRQCARPVQWSASEAGGGPALRLLSGRVVLMLSSECLPWPGNFLSTLCGLSRLDITPTL